MDVVPPEGAVPPNPGDECALAVYPPTLQAPPDLPKLAPEQMVVYKTTAGGTRREVTQRDDDLLIPSEVKEHHKEVEAAMLKELHTWAKLNCFSRKKRAVARNIIDTHWVIKWKWDHDAVDVDASIGGRGSAETNGKSGAKRTIRARLTVRGFKDHDRNDIDRYAGTSSRSSQKVLVSEAVLRGWDIATADISKAFLQGVTYKELAELTGDKVREVNFLPPQLEHKPSSSGTRL